MRNPKPKSYIGDGAYAEFDGYAIVLTTEDGLQTTNRIVLEPEVFTELIRYAAHSMAIQIRADSSGSVAIGLPKGGG